MINIIDEAFSKLSQDQIEWLFANGCATSKNGKVTVDWNKAKKAGFQSREVGSSSNSNKKSDTNTKRKDPLKPEKVTSSKYENFPKLPSGKSAMQAVCNNGNTSVTIVGPDTRNGLDSIAIMVNDNDNMYDGEFQYSVKDEAKAMKDFKDIIAAYNNGEDIKDIAKKYNNKL